MPRAAERPAALGPFELLHPLARGAMGEVWAGRHRRSGREVAVKVIRAPTATSTGLRLALAREVRAVARLDHPGVVRVYDQGVVPREAEVRSRGRLLAGTPYLVMERARTNLGASPPGPGWDQVASTLDAILAALAHAHSRKVLHRDLKPTNVLIGERGELRLADFGLSRVLEVEAERPGGGTPRYMAPEQRAGSWEDEGPWTDLYALGCVLWELVCGGPPWFDSGGAPDAFHPMFPVPAGLEEVARKLLAPRIGDRYPTAAEARAALRELSGSPAPPASGAWRELARHRTMTHLEGAGLGVFAHRVHRVAGREAERDLLWEQLGDVIATGRPRLVVLEGAAGIGKSRLARWLCETAEEAGVARSLRVGFSRSAGPHDGLVPALSRELGCASAPRAELLARLSAREPQGDLVTWSELAELLRPRSPDEPLHGLLATELDPPARLRVARDFLIRQARQVPLVVWLDDAHLDPEAAALTAAVLDAPEDRSAPVVLLATATGQDHWMSDAPTRPGAVSRLPLHRLPDLVLGGLIRDLLGISPELARDVERRSEGNPLFAVQLVADWVSRQLLVDGPEGFAPAPGADLGIPDALHALWADRLRHALTALPGEARDLVELAAWLGQHVDLREWEALCGGRADLALELLETLADAELVQLEGSGWSFAHGLLVESVQRLAEERGRAPAQKMEVARFLLSRGRADLDRGRAPGAAATFERARWLTAADPGLAAETIGLLGTAYKRLGRLDEAEALLGEALARHRALGQRAQQCTVLTHLGDLWAQRGRAAEGSTLLDEACALAEALGDPGLRAPALGNKASALFYTGDHEAAAALYTETIALLGALGNRREQGIALGNLASLMRTRGRLSDSEPLFQEALAAHREVGNRRSEGVVLGNIAILNHQQGRDDEAMITYGQALAIHRELGNRRSEGLVLGNLASLHLDRKEYALARARSAEALAIHRAIGDRRSEGIALLSSALADLGAGRLDEVEQGLLAALEIHRAVRNRGHEAGTLGALGDLCDRIDDPEGARRNYTQALEIYRETGERIGQVRALGMLAKLDHARRGDPWPALDEAHRIARTIGGPLLLGLLCTRAAIHADRGDLAAALATIGEARDHASTLPPPVTLEALTELARIERGVASAGGDAAR